MKKADLHSDLAHESIEELVENTHYKRTEKHFQNTKIETYTILKEHPSISQKVGTYVEIQFEDYQNIESISNSLQDELKQFLEPFNYPRILIVGLGNQYLTSDAIGPRTIRDIRVSHYMDIEDCLQSGYYDISALAPGVMVQTGMESSDIIKAIVKNQNIDLVIAIDALCARDYHKLCRVIQINNVGIVPGSGIGNHRKEITKNSLGIDVIAVGVPTVIYASSIVQEAMMTTIDYFGDQLNMENILKIGKRTSYSGSLTKQQKEMMLGHIGTLEKHELEALFQEVLTPIGRNFVLSDKKIDEQCEIISKIISKSINDLRY